MNLLKDEHRTPEHDLSRWNKRATNAGKVSQFKLGFEEDAVATRWTLHSYHDTSDKLVVAWTI